MGGQFGPHSYDPGIMAGSVVMWGSCFPDGSVDVDIGRDISRATAQLEVHNVPVFDTFTLGNSFDPTHALGIFSAFFNSMKIKLGGVTRSVVGFSDSTNKFRGDFYQCSATLAVEATTPPETGNGFHFKSDPSTTVTGFAQFGTESNGVFF